MHSHRVRASVVAFVTAAVLFAVPATAAADITAFLGLGNKPSTRAARGLSLGITVLVVGIEFEGSHISEDTGDGAPQVRTGMVNALVQTPTSGAQLYGTVGAGVYRETFRNGPQETNTGVNIGGGLKLGLVGPLKLRLDYRLFKFRGDAVYKTVHRVYAGVNAGF
jgi:opacity protein-like surface antigen